MRRPREAACRLCTRPVPPGRLYFDDEDCARRFDALSRAGRSWARLDGAQEPPPASAAEIRPGMTPEAVRWRVERSERLAAAAA